MLHLYSNFKWTGPSEPAVSLVAGLQKLGVEVILRSSGYTKGNPVNHIVEKAGSRGVFPLTDLNLSKHRALWRDASDVRRLRRIMERESTDLVHCHLPNDTQIAARALRGLSVPFVRTLYETEPDRILSRDLASVRRARRVFIFSHAMADALVRLGLRRERLVHVESAIDLERFRPGDDLPNLRSELGFSREDFVAGIVARVQPQRRFDLLLDVAAELRQACPRFRLLIIGRGSRLERTARTPARRRGLLDEVVFFPGHFEDAAYPAVLRALDVKLFMVPGSDGTARAVREALASGLPVLTIRRGILPELVRDGVTGRVLDESVEAFTTALLELWRDAPMRRRMGEAARRDASERFGLDRQAADVRTAYRTLLAEAA